VKNVKHNNIIDIYQLS